MSRDARWGVGHLAARAHGLRRARPHRGGWVSPSTRGAVGRGLRALGRLSVLRLWAVLPPAACPLRLLLPGPRIPNSGLARGVHLIASGGPSRSGRSPWVVSQPVLAGGPSESLI
eukprot:5158277-Pyramimonas_sp.AAC.1